MYAANNSSNTLHIPRSKFYISTSSVVLSSRPSEADAEAFDSYQSASDHHYHYHHHPHPPAPRLRHTNMREMIDTTTEDEFDALPIAVRRKYFSTLERLRFAQNSGGLPSDEDLTGRRRDSLADRRGLRQPPTVNSSRRAIGGTVKGRSRKSTTRSSVSSADVSWLLTLPEKLRRKQLMAEEQNLHGNRRGSVILDAADEAIYKASRRASRNLAPMAVSPTTLCSRGSMDSERSEKRDSRPSSITKAMMESFRWMDEESDLDLRLGLDDYHANLDGVVLPTPASSQRPSFRRHISITKIPFGRTSLSSMNQTSTSNSSPLPHARQRSRALSLIQSKHSASESISSIDPGATHYQDPEARLKLRVYLASPQKFDEAIEFGFPSIDGVTVADKENKQVRRASREKNSWRSPLGDSGQTFLEDDIVSLSDDDASMLDPDSPLTPSETCPTFRSQPSRHACPSKSGRASDDFSHLGIKKPVLHKHTDSYAQSVAGSREMTLRMTLTRPDLRADENMLYGWQGLRNRSPLGDEIPRGSEASSMSRNEVKGPLGGFDGWGPVEKDDGVVKRFWNKMKSSQRRTV